MINNIDKTIQYKGNTIIKLRFVQPYFEKLNSYLIHFDRYVFHSYARRTSGDKYTCTHSKQFCLLDLSEIDVPMRNDFILDNWMHFVSQLDDRLVYSNDTLLPVEQLSEMITTHPKTDRGIFQLGKMYATLNGEVYSFPSLDKLYASILVQLDCKPSLLTLEVWSGYDNRTMYENQYYNCANFNNDISKSLK